MVDVRQRVHKRGQVPGPAHAAVLAHGGHQAAHRRVADLRREAQLALARVQPAVQRRQRHARLHAHDLRITLWLGL